MYRQFSLLPCAAALLSIHVGCASSYDPRLIERRTHELYEQSGPGPIRDDPDEQAPQAPRLLAQASLERYLEFGLLSSAKLRSAFEAWRASTERVEQVSTLPDPKLSFGEFLEEVQTRTGPQKRRVGLSQAFPWPGDLSSRAALATHQSEVAWQHVEQVRLAVAREIEVSFHEYAFLARELAITQELLSLVKGLEPVVQGRIRGGAGQEGLLRLQVEIGRLEDDLASIQRRRPAMSSRLADAMNLPLETATLLPLPDMEIPVPELVLAASELVDLALNASPKLRALSQQLAAARVAEDRTSFKRRPVFAAQVDYIDTGDALSSSTPGSGDDPLFVGLTMSLPIWSASYSAAEREARHTVRAARARLDDARTSLQADVTEEAFRVDDAQRRIQLYSESLIPRAREALQLSTVSYRAGSASVLELLDSERALLEFELSLWRACREYLQGEARLRSLVGGEVE